MRQETAGKFPESFGKTLKMESPLEATQDPHASLDKLLQAHLALARDTTGAASGSLVREIAANLHVDPRTVTNWLKGRHRPHDEMIQDLVDTLVKLIPLPQDMADRAQVLARQRQAIHAACLKRTEDVNPAKDTPETLETLETSETPPEKTGNEGASSRSRRFERKHTALLGGMAALTFFSVVWATSVTVQGPSDHPVSVGQTLLIGGFEEPSLADGNGSLYFPKNAAWRIWGRNGGGIQRNQSPWGADTAPEGVQTAFMQSGDVHMSRDVQLTPGTYTISLHAARRRFGQENPNPLQILVNGKEVSDVIVPESTRFQRYTSRSFTVSTSALHTIEIATRSRQAPFGDTFVDKIELNTLAAEPDGEALKSPFDMLGSKLRSWGADSARADTNQARP